MYWDYRCALWARIVIESEVIEVGMVAHACNPSTWEAETRGSEFAARLSYLVRPSAT